ncbi:MAG: SPOR domain-containing protein [Mycobacteriales bacterium]
MSYYWCTDHHEVEKDAGCRAEVRLGPFPTREAAERALETVQERNEKADAEDRAWEEGED